MKCLLMMAILFYGATSSSTAQLKMIDLHTFPLGTSYSDYTKVKKMFKGEPDIFKADFLGAYKLEYDETPFDFYGDADYTIQFVKEVLSNVEIEFKFRADRMDEFERLLKQLLLDLKADTTKFNWKEHNTLNIQNALAIARKECIKTTAKEHPKYKPIKGKRLGTTVFSLLNQENDGRFLMIECLLYQVHQMTQVGNQEKQYYDGGEVSVTLSLTNKANQDLKYLESGQKVNHYKTYKIPAN